MYELAELSLRPLADKLTALIEIEGQPAPSTLLLTPASTLRHTIAGKVCWKWLGQLAKPSKRQTFSKAGTSRFAYPLITHASTRATANRFFASWFFNIPLRGDRLQNNCGNPQCVNPFHWLSAQQVTQAIKLGIFGPRLEMAWAVGDMAVGVESLSPVGDSRLLMSPQLGEQPSEEPHLAPVPVHHAPTPLLKPQPLQIDMDDPEHHLPVSALERAVARIFDAKKLEDPAYTFTVSEMKALVEAAVYSDILEPRLREAIDNLPVINKRCTDL